MIAALVMLAAAAGNAPAMQDARAFFEAGEQAYAAGAYAVAIRALEESYTRAPLPAVAFSLAQSYRRQYLVDGDVRWLQQALPLFRRYLQDEPGGTRHEHALQHVGTLEQILAARAPVPPAAVERRTQLLVSARVPGALARVGSGAPAPVPLLVDVTPGEHAVEVTAPGHAPAGGTWLAVEDHLVVAQLDPQPLPARVEVLAEPGVSLHVDGREVGTVPLGRALFLEPGGHHLAATRSGHVPVQRELRVGPGEVAHLHVPALEPTRQRIAARWMLGGAAGAAALSAVAAVLALAAQEQAVDLDPSGGGATEAQVLDYRAARAQRDDLRTASLSLLGGAGALATAGVLLHLFDRAPPPRREPEEPWTRR